MSTNSAELQNFPLPHANFGDSRANSRNTSYNSKVSHTKPQNSHNPKNSCTKSQHSHDSENSYTKSGNPHNYDDIINTTYPFPQLAKRKRLDPTVRAAEFAPFAALTGYHETIDKVSKNSNDPTMPTITNDYFSTDFNQ